MTIKESPYFALAERFWTEDEGHPISPIATKLYFKLLHEANRRYWRGPVVLSWTALQGLLGVSRPSIWRAINTLTSRGLIIYKKGKRSSFWFPILEESKNRSEENMQPDTSSGSKNEPVKNFNQSAGENGSKFKPPLVKKINRLKKLTDPVTDPVTNPVTNLETPYINTNTNTNTNTKKEEIKNTSSPYGEDANLRFAWSKNQDLNRYEKELIDVWESIIGPFKPEWLPLLKEALRICYPAQVKSAIVTLARTKAEVMKEKGFEYVMEPIRKGAFGKRGKKRNTAKSFRDSLSGLKSFLEGE